MYLNIQTHCQTESDVELMMILHSLTKMENLFLCRFYSSHYLVPSASAETVVHCIPPTVLIRVWGFSVYVEHYVVEVKSRSERNGILVL